ncbi:MAG TPA: hypothetical protein PKY59_11220 [Pyrinomonadaceae bacterium]|nr:hypothetical protein [Pyrinomonadaceae bacterium]
MSLREQQNLLARLYTDKNLREKFFAEPKNIGFEFDLTQKEINEIVEIAPQELNFFAESLFWKRLREAEKFLPFTKEILKVDFQIKFKEFSQNFNPQSVKKHLEDAIEFCGFLQKCEVSEIAKNIAAYESAKISFYGYGKSFSFCKLNYDLRKYFRGESAEILLKRRKFAIWIKIGNKTRHFFIWHEYFCLFRSGL